MREGPAKNVDPKPAAGGNVLSPLIAASFSFHSSLQFRAAFNRQQDAHSLHPWWHFENEERFFVPSRELLKEVDLEKLPREVIYQAYFPRAKTMALLHFAQKISPDTRFPAEDFVTRCRIRRIRREGRPSEYFFAVQGPKKRKLLAS